MFMQVIEAEKSEALIASASGEEGVDSNNETPLWMERFTLQLQQLSAANHDGERRPRQSAKSQRTPAAVGLSAPAIKSERTPRYDNKKSNDETHEDRCRTCLGIYPAKIETTGRLVDDQKGKKKKKKKKTAKLDNRTRRLCDYCGKRTDYMCLGCRRFLCFSAPSKKKSKKKHPKHFSVQTPILNKKTGTLRRERKTKKLICDTIIGHWTCFHASHREAWATYTESNKHQIYLCYGERERERPLEDNQRR